MKKTIIKNALHTLLGLGILMSRFVGLPFNVSLVGTFGFFGPRNVLLFFIPVVVFDMLHPAGMYPGMMWTYLGFLCYFAMGWLAKGKYLRQAALVPVASVGFFLFSNFGSFLTLYPKTFAGLQLCYTNAIPFFKATLFGDVVFGYSFIASHALGTYMWRKYKEREKEELVMM